MRIVLLLVAGVLCAATGQAAETNAEPFVVEFARRLPDSNEVPKFDPALSGYRVNAGIARLKIRPRDQGAKLPARLVWTIETTAGLPPMLEGFTLSAPGQNIRAGLKLRTEEVERTNETIRKVAAGTYFQIRATRSGVTVTFPPKAMELLKDECTIEWVDWYRH